MPKVNRKTKRKPTMAQRNNTSRSSASNKPYKYKYKKKSTSKAKLLLGSFKKNKKLAPALAILLFAAIGSSFVYFAKASTVTLSNIEAETMTLASGSRVVNDSAASGSKAVQFDANSAVTGQVTLAQAATSITVRAKGTQCKGAPQMVVALGGTQVLSSSVSSSGYSDYTADISLAKGTHALSISFNNSYSYTHNNAKKNCSRNMTVDKITMYGVSSEAVSSSNLSAGRPVTTSASWSERLPLATDGKMDTGYANIAGGPQWIQIDLGQQQPVGTVKLWHYFQDSRTYRDVIVQLSNTADFSSSKTTIYNNDRDNSSGQVAGNDSEYSETSAGKAISLASAIDARYVRLWSNGSNVNGANHYVEVEVSKNINAETPPVSPAPSPQPAPEPAPIKQKITSWRAPGSAPLSDTEAASRVTSKPEKRPNNTIPNSYKATASELDSFRYGWRERYNRTNVDYDPAMLKVTGNFSGTTDEIIQWGAHKWGIPEDWLRAQAVTESWWNQSQLGDREDGKTSAQMAAYPAYSHIDNDSVYTSLGIMQDKWHPECEWNQNIACKAGGIEPLRHKSTAFNVDYTLATIRYYFDGKCYWCENSYAPGQEWESLSAHYNPYPWKNSGQLNYINTVKNHLANRTWEKSTF